MGNSLLFGNDESPIDGNTQTESLTTKNIFSPTVMQQLNAWLRLPIASQFGLNHRLLIYKGVVETGHNTKIRYSCGDDVTDTIAGYPLMTFDGLDYATVDSITGLKEAHFSRILDILRNGYEVEAFFWLELLDILNLDFSILWEVKGDYYILQKIKDFRCNLNKATKCELIRL